MDWGHGAIVGCGVEATEEMEPVVVEEEVVAVVVLEVEKIVVYLVRVYIVG